MTFPASWPPRPPSGIRSLRFYATGVATALFTDTGFMFAEQILANPFTPLPVVVPGTKTTVDVPDDAGTGLATPVPVTGAEGPSAQIWSSRIRICATGGTLEFTFDGTHVHGQVLSGESFYYTQRFESGISVRGAGVTYRIEAW